MQANNPSYRPDIDGLRAIAVLGVVFCHAGLGMPGGYVGVDVFFVISGYLIASLILKDLERGKFSLADFWERRIRRILPALLVMTVSTLAIGATHLIPNDYEALGRSVVGLALLISNVQFWRGTDYFAADATEKPLLHTWSLAVEEQFYLFLPVILLLLARSRIWHRAFAMIALAAIASFVLSVYGTFKHPYATFYLLPTRTWELLAGVLLAFRRVDSKSQSELQHGFAGAAGLVLVLVPYVLYDQKTLFPGLAAVPPVLGTVLLIASGRPSEQLSRVSRFLAWSPLVFIGLISYSFYLWHWPLFTFARYQSIVPLTITQRISLVVASFALGILSWRYIELPFRRRELVTNRPRLWQIAALAYACLLCGGYTVCYNRGFVRRLPPEVQRFSDTGRKDQRFTPELNAEDVPENLVRLGVPSAPAKLLVWGDSHAMAILPAIDAVCREAGVSARAATHSATAPAINYFSRQRFGLNERAIPFSASVIEYVESVKIPAVILVASWALYFQDDDFPIALLKTVDALKARGATVYFMMDVPVFDFDVPKALILYSWRGWKLNGLTMPPENYLVANHFYVDFLPRLQERGVRILDPLPVLQSRTQSTALAPFDAGGSFYFDKRHLSVYGALALRPLFGPVIRSIRLSSPPAPG